MTDLPRSLWNWLHTTGRSQVAAPDAAFVRALLDPLPLSDALDAAGSGFAFDRWLADALASRLLTGMNLQE